LVEVTQKLDMQAFESLLDARKSVWVIQHIRIKIFNRMKLKYC